MNDWRKKNKTNRHQETSTSTDASSHPRSSKSPTAKTRKSHVCGQPWPLPSRRNKNVTPKFARSSLQRHRAYRQFLAREVHTRERTLTEGITVRASLPDASIPREESMYARGLKLVLERRRGAYMDLQFFTLMRLRARVAYYCNGSRELQMLGRN